jgi:DNA-binding MarR family transcriptional regulator
MSSRPASAIGDPPSPAATDASQVAARALHMMGADAEREWTADEAIAWEGLLEVARRLRRDAEHLLLADAELTISMLGITGRLSRAPAGTLRQSALADAMGLSVSRVSRVIDLLEERGLVRRRPCPADARATNVTLTRRGRTLTAHAQRNLFAFVQSAFCDQLQPGEAAVLGAVFTRLLDRCGPEAPGT